MSKSKLTSQLKVIDNYRRQRRRLGISHNDTEEREFRNIQTIITKMNVAADVEEAARKGGQTRKADREARNVVSHINDALRVSRKYIDRYVPSELR